MVGSGGSSNEYFWIGKRETEVSVIKWINLFIKGK